MITQTSKTYACTKESCDWHYQCLTENDPYSAYYTQAFTVTTRTGIQLRGVPAGCCASCYAQGVFSEIFVEDDEAKMSTHNTMELPEIEAERLVEKDEDGRPIMIPEPEGATVFKFNRETGQSDEVPVMVEKMRDKTQEEVDEDHESAQRMVDHLDTLRP